ECAVNSGFTMRYVFKVLALGNPRFSIKHLVAAFNDKGENRGPYKEWYRELNVLENICDLEIDAITDFITADFDDIIPSVDGIVYFLDPLNEEESELFNIIIPIIFSVKRDIPTIILFYNPDGIIPISTNELLEKVWVNYPNLEAFVNLFPNQFHQVLQCLCLAMISGDTPLNIENAWMRYPIYLQLANFYFINKNYFYAAQAIKKLSAIAEIYNKQEFYIFSEQSAYLFTKMSLFLEASNVLEATDPKLSNTFKKYYAERMILEGNLLFNKNKYEDAAIQYESAGQWASIELNDKRIVKSAFELAINAWISACQVEKAFLILERLPHQDIVPLLENLASKINAAADFLISNGNFIDAKEQLYYAIFRFQKESLFEHLKIFVVKLLEVLIKIYEEAISSRTFLLAKETFDEIENIWDSFKIKKTNYDNLLEKLITLAIEKLDFSMAGVLINKLESMDLKKQLNKYNLKKEEENKKFVKKEQQEYIQTGIEVLNEFFQAEMDIIAQMNSKKIEQANSFIEQNDWLKAALHIKTQADFLREIGKSKIESQILAKSMDILLEGKYYNEFFEYFSFLNEDLQKAYLVRVYPSFIAQLKEIKSGKDFDDILMIFEKSITIYRTHDLYEESKQISEIFIRLLEEEGKKIVSENRNLKGINLALGIIKKILTITSAYLDKFKVNFDDIYKQIAEIYIYELNDLASANVCNDKIEDKEIKKEIHKIIAHKESEKSAEAARIAKDSIKGEFLKERFSIIEKKARDALHDKVNELKKRTGIKRAYFKDALNYLKNKDFEKAIESYLNSTKRLLIINRYNLAAVSFAMSCLLLFKQNKINDISNLFEEENELFSNKLFTETFPVILINYLMDMKNINENLKYEEAALFLESLPLFDEELDVLYDHLGRKRVHEQEEKTIEKIVNISDIEKNIRNYADKIENTKRDVGKRNLMKKDYWEKALEQLSEGNLTSASIIYLDTFNELASKDLYKHAAISLIMGCLILITEKSVRVASLTFDRQISTTPKIKRNELQNLAEILLMEHIFKAHESHSNSLIRLSYKQIIDKLILFEPEIEFLRQYTDAVDLVDDSKQMLSRKERAQLSDYNLKIEQLLDDLQLKMRDVLSDSKSLLEKRTAMRRHYYDDVLLLLKRKEFQQANKKYLQIAEKISKRNDFKTSSLLVLLFVLTSLKAENSIEDIENKIEVYLNSLGLNKPLVKETYEISLVLFILEVFKRKLTGYIQKIKELLEVLPLFMEERNMTEIDLY
ncbi:MAG: hypothetical protein JW891_07195, partial [Candidatus Lokiarchaeota archaeon]|nr:hypothetical protein [Candidatus Lokiarchaeota archaeon]